MINFKKFLNEKELWFQDKTSRFALLGTHFPVSPKMLERLFGKTKIETYHAISPERYRDLLAMQGTRKSLSTFDYLNKSELLVGGVSGNSGGVLVKVSGNILIRGKTDMKTAPDVEGRRWVRAVDDRSDLRMPIGEALKKAYDDVFDDGFNYTKAIRIEDKKKKGKVIKLFFDNIEKWANDNKAKLKEILFPQVKKESAAYNEILVNEIKVERVWVFEGDREYSHQRIVKMGVGNAQVFAELNPTVKFETVVYSSQEVLNNFVRTEINK